MSEQAPLPADDQPVLEDLIVEFLTRIESDPGARGPVLEDLCRRWPDWSEALRVALGNLDQAGFLGGTGRD